MAKKWLDSIQERKKSNICDKQTDRRTHRQTESTTKNNRLLARRGDQYMPIQHE